MQDSWGCIPIPSCPSWPSCLLQVALCIIRRGPVTDSSNIGAVKTHSKCIGGYDYLKMTRRIPEGRAREKSREREWVRWVDFALWWFFFLLFCFVLFCFVFFCCFLFLFFLTCLLHVPIQKPNIKINESLSIEFYCERNCGDRELATKVKQVVSVGTLPHCWQVIGKCISSLISPHNKHNLSSSG